MDFGSLICKPINPICTKCDLNKLCKYTFPQIKLKKSLKMLIRYVLFSNIKKIT